MKCLLFSCSKQDRSSNILQDQILRQSILQQFQQLPSQQQQLIAQQQQLQGLQQQGTQQLQIQFPTQLQQLEQINRLQSQRKKRSNTIKLFPDLVIRGFGCSRFVFRYPSLLKSTFRSIENKLY